MNNEILLPSLIAALSLTACTGIVSDDVNTKPGYLGTITSTQYDGSSDDLLNAGLGRSGLGSATAPAVADPAAPTAAERAAFNAATPNRFAFKHAHSQQNPEKDWGKWTL